MLECTDFSSRLGAEKVEVLPLRTKLQRMIASLRQRRVVSARERDVYGQPLTVTGWKALVHVLAGPAVLGVVVGYLLAIALLLIHTFSDNRSHQVNNRAQNAAWEIFS